MPLQIPPAQLSAWLSKAEAAGLPVTLARKRRPKRTPEQLRADLLRAIDLAPSPLARRVLLGALERFDQGRR